MKVLFCHDGPLRKDQFNNYYGTAHNDKTFTRYYDIAEELTVLIRLEDISKSKAETTLSKITVNPFNVIKLPNVSSIKGLMIDKRKAKKVVADAVAGADYIVARLPSMSGFLAVDYAKKMGKPYLVEVVACPWDAFWNHSTKGKLIAPFMYKATKKRVLNAPYVVYVTNEFLQKRYPTKGKKVNCSNVALVDFDDHVIKNRQKKILSMSEKQKIVIGTTAAVNVKYKGQQYIIRALGELKQKGITNFEYQLVGGGDQSYLKSLAHKYNVDSQVKFLGPMSHENVFSWLECIDIYVQPSRQEGLPRALIEAMSRGLPSFGSNTAGIPELIEPPFIFSNTKNNISEICEILSSITKETMMEQSVRNYNESKKYESKIIGNRRKEFFNQFKKFD
ncbi:glycosyltransferase [Priestia megaterium]